MVRQHICEATITALKAIKVTALGEYGTINLNKASIDVI
jgi:hypothetical protein